MSEYAKKLEQEADELLNQHYTPQPEAAEPTAEVEEATPEGEEVAETPDAEPNAEPETAPVEDTAVVQDELDGLTLQNAAERIKNAQARMHRATQEAADLRRALAAQEQAALQMRAEIERSKTTPPAAKPESVGDDATLDQLAEEYPDTIGPLLTTIKALQSRVDQLTPQSPAAQAVQAPPTHTPDMAATTHYATVLAAHPDAFEVAETPEFQGWITRQGPQAQAVLDQGNAQQVVALLSGYKKSIGQAKRMQAAAAVADPAVPKARKQPITQGQPKFTRAQIAAMSPAEFTRREAEIDEAMAKGLVI